MSTKVRMSASNYTSRKGGLMVMVRIPIQDAAAIAVGRREVIDELRELIATKLTSERESSYGQKKEVEVEPDAPTPEVDTNDTDIEEKNDESTA